MRRLDAGIAEYVNNLPGFMGMIVKRKLISKLDYTERRRDRTVSLEAPISDGEDSFTLADLLPSSSTVMQPEAALIANEDMEAAFLWVPVVPSHNTRVALRRLGETAPASLVGGAV